MDLVGVGREALRTAWRNKVLWIFGLFVTGGGGGGGQVRATDASDAGSLADWAWALVAVALVLGAAALVMHVVSEGALIDGVARARAGGAVRARDGFRAGRRAFGRVLRVKLLAIAVVLATVLFLAAPALLAFARVLSPLDAILLTLPAAALGVPFLLTVHFAYAFALRIAVVDARPALPAVREAVAFLHGRILEALKLFVLAFVGQIGGGLLAAAASLPGVLAGGLLYLVSGTLEPALAVGGALALPPMLAAVGAMGTFRSTVWTVGFLESRAAARV